MTTTPFHRPIACCEGIEAAAEMAETVQWGMKFYAVTPRRAGLARGELALEKNCRRQRAEVVGTPSGTHGSMTFAPVLSRVAHSVSIDQSISRIKFVGKKSREKPLIEMFQRFSRSFPKIYNIQYFEKSSKSITLL